MCLCGCFCLLLVSCCLFLVWVEPCWRAACACTVTICMHGQHGGCLLLHAVLGTLSAQPHAQRGQPCCACCSWCYVLGSTGSTGSIWYTLYTRRECMSLHASYSAPLPRAQAGWQLCLTAA